jgi:alkanesulfonate monooxygenase SsuD/methylene tetrahydromethanopterin reductase-like flavin-dependent oxidoreductase (luciferase family)
VAPQIRDTQADADASAGRAPFSVSWADTETLSRQWSAHVIGCTRAGRRAHPRDWRVARTVLITDDGAVARDMVMSADSPCRAYFRSVMGAEASDAAIDEKIDACVLHGNPDMVAERLLKTTRATAVFGTLVLADHAWADAERALRSMRLLHDVVEHCFSCADRQLVSGWQ